MYVGNEKAKMHGTPQEIKSFVSWLTRLGYAEATINSYERLLGNFFKYLDGKTPSQELIEDFNHYLHQTAAGRGYISAHLNTIKQYSRYLELTIKEKLVLRPLIVEKEVKIQRVLFTQKEMHRLYEGIDENTPQGLQDKAILSLYYGCGLRSREGIKVEAAEVDYHRSLVYVKPSKNYSSRYVPMSTKVRQDIEEYVKYGREIINPDSPYLLVGKTKEQINSTYLNKRLKHLQQEAGITKNGSLHSLRHSIATHFLQNGMELEHIGEFLGHKSMDATQIYTHIVEDLEDENL